MLYLGLVVYLFHVLTVTMCSSLQGSNVLEEQDLTELGILIDDHRNKILESSAKLPKLKPISK